MPMLMVFMYNIQLLRVLGSRNREHGEEEIIKNLTEGNFLKDSEVLQNKGLTNQDEEKKDQDRDPSW